MKAKLTPAMKHRLGQLANYLESLPPRYRHFEMSRFVDENITSAKRIAEYALHNGGVDKCGTVACAVGHGPAAGILFPPRMVIAPVFRGDQPVVNWSSYSGLFVGEDWQTNRDRRNLFQWLFAGEWSTIDNGHYGAAARIRYYLAGNEPPADCNYYGNVKRTWRKLYAPFRKNQRRVLAKVPA